MTISNVNRIKIQNKTKMSYNEAKERIKPEKANRYPRRVNRYHWATI